MSGVVTRSINDNFGSKRGLLRFVKYKIWLYLGRFRDYQDIDFESVRRLVFICYGNICRSPFAEYLARSKGLEAISYGLHCKGEKGADPRAIEFAKSQGIDMVNHRTTNIKDYQKRVGDLFVVMEPEHVDDLKSALGFVEQITIATLWNSRRSAYLHDPYSANKLFFEKCEWKLVEAISMLQSKMSSATPVKLK
jgi:protein-tyrosine phosphatase